MFSLRQKLILALTLLVVLVLGSAAVFFVKEKEHDVVRDSFYSVRAFAEFTADRVADDYDTYWAQKGYAFFNRDIADILGKTDAIQGLRLYAYDGTILYDSVQESNKAYVGTKRTEKDESILRQIRSKLISVQDNTGVIHFIQRREDGTYQFVDENGKPTSDFDDSIQIRNVVISARDQYAVMYQVTYASLAGRMSDVQKRMIILAAFGVLIGIFFAVLFASKIIQSINVLVDSAAVLAKGDFSHRVDIHSGDELEVLGNSFNAMADEIDHFTKDLVNKERVTKELELAAKIQTEILPKDVPHIPDLDIAAGLIPAEEVGGDCYDFLHVGDRLLFYLGDATGHGVPAGILVSIANALLYYLSHRKALLEIMIEANEVMKAKSANNMFMTMAMMEWDAKKKTLQYVNAGHEPLIVYNAQKGKAEEHRGGGMALGMLPDNSKVIKEITVPFGIGDVLVIYSDGLPECWKDENEIFGMDRLKETIKQCGTMPTALAIRNAILGDIKQFAGSYKQMDDMTIIVVKRKA